MTGEALAQTRELAALLAAVTDPRTIPARFSTLKAAGISGAHYLHACQWSGDETLAMRIGSGAHGLLLGQPVVEYPGKTRHGKQWDAFKSEHVASTILTGREMSRASAIADAVRGNPIAHQVVLEANAVHEQTIEWEWLGRRCRSTPDVRGVLSIADLKTTKCAEPGKFARDAMYRGYHAQLAFYRLACEYAGHGRARRVYVVAVESQPPYAVTVLQLTERALEQGERLCRSWMERLLGFEAANAYPGYLESIGEFDVPDDDEVGLVFGDEEEESE
jgi:hypothetical protein